MERRKFIAGLGSLTAAGAAGIGTGAFTSVSASRNVSVETTGDASALLAFDDDNAGPNSAYADIPTDGQLTLQFDGSDVPGDGLNDNASFIIRDIFDIKNNGTQAVWVWVDSNTLPDGMSFYADYPANTDNAGESLESGPGGQTNGLGGGPGYNPSNSPPVNRADLHKIPSGETMREIGVSLNTNKLGDDFDTSVTFVAKSDSELEDV